MKTPAHHKGSALLTVLVLTIAMGLIAAALIAYAVTERKLNRHLLLRLQAQDAAEATLEYGAAQIARQAPGNQNIPATYFNTTNKPTLDSLRIATLYPAISASSNSFVDSTSTSLWVSNVTAPGVFKIDTNDLRNKNDPLQTMNETAQSVRLLSQATATDKSGNSITDYATESVQIRQSCLLQFAVFYGITMEFGPSAQVDVYGPVFSNADTYLTQSGGPLTFHSSFNVAGNFYATPLGGASGSARPTGQNINFTDGLARGDPSAAPNPLPASSAGGDSSENFYSILNPDIGGTNLGSGVWADSTLNVAGSGDISRALPNETFGGVGGAANYLWNGMVNANVTPLQTPGINTTSPAIAHEIIEPPNPITTGASAAQPLIEQSKISTAAGVYIVVQPNSAGTGAIVTAFGPGGGNTAAQNALLYEYGSAANEAAGLKQAPNASYAGPGVITLPAGTAAKAAGGGKLAVPATPGAVTTNRIMFDPRENKTLNTVDIDLGVLANNTGFTAVGTTAAAVPTSPTALQSAWNGIIYVDVQTISDSNPNLGSTTISNGWTATSDITDSGGHPLSGTGTETAVRLVDGAQLPSMGVNGLALGTNAPVYVIGQLNGNENTTLTGGTTPTESQVMTPDSNEVPALIAGDSMNLLSNAWQSPIVDPNTGKTIGYQPTGDAITTTKTGTGTGNIASATNTEYDAAFISGNVATTGGGSSYSGGVENYMRFNEDWSGGVIARYRGSIIALYNSEVATGPWGQANYKVPLRQMAYDYMFQGPTATNGYTHAAEFPAWDGPIYVVQFIDYSDMNNATFTTMLNDANYGFKKVQ